MTSFSARIIGPGRAGHSFAGALTRAGWTVDLLSRDADRAKAAVGVDLVLIATPDAAIAGVARDIVPVPETVVAHIAGAVGLDVLAGHERAASIHPLAALPDGDLGADRLVGAWFSISGDPWITHVVEALGGTSFEVDDDHRAEYHAAACVASNHLVALLGQVERIAAGAGVPWRAYLDLVRATVDNVDALGPAAALTGPVARGDWDTVARHLASIDEGERLAYRALADAAERLVCAP